MRKETYREIIDRLWWRVWDAFEPDRYDLPDNLLVQADKLLNSLDLEDQLLLVEFMRGTVLNNIEMLDLELLAAAKAEERAQDIRTTGGPPHDHPRSEGLVAEIVEDEFGLFLALPDGWACELPPEAARALADALRDTKGARLTVREEAGRIRAVETLVGASA